jgi:hypothetical protein
MFSRIFLGKEELVKNTLGEREKSIVFSNSFLFCEEKSVKRSEFYQAIQTGLNIEKVISMNKYEYYEYKNNAIKMFAKVEDSFTLNLIEYTVVREFETDSDNIELTLKRGVENVSA